MRILRSQYLQLQNNLNTSKKSAAQHASSRQQQPHITSRPAPYHTSKKCYDLRRRSIVSYSGGYDSNTSGSISQRTRLKTTDSVSSRKALIERRISSSSDSSYCSITSGSSSTSSSTSSSSTEASTISSGYETLNQTKNICQNDTQTIITQPGNDIESNQTTNRTYQNDTQTIMTRQPEQTLEKCQTLEEASYVENTMTKFEQFHIKFSNVPQTVGKINLRVQFTNVTPQWLTQIYRTYEDDLWRKVPRVPVVGKCRWLYNCTLCQKQLCQFVTLKTHLNQHLEFYPYVCKFCTKPYTNRRSMVCHLQGKHNIKKEYEIYIGQ